MTITTTMATTLVTGRLARADQFLQHPDRQRGLLSASERGDDDLVEGKREGEHAAREQCGTDVRQDDITKCLEAIGAEVHRGFHQRTGDTAEARNSIVVDNDDTESRVTKHDGPERKRDIRQAER